MLTMTLLAVLLAGAPAAHAAPRPAARPAAQAKAAVWHPVVPFIEDDFGRALALAKARKLPVFNECWAPW